MALKATPSSCSGNLLTNTVGHDMDSGLYRMEGMNLLARHRGHAEMDHVERGMLTDLVTCIRPFNAGDVLVPAHVPSHESVVLLEGTLGRVINTRDGRRQIVAVHFPGDFVDLHSLFLHRLDHDILAMRACTVAVIPHAPLHRLLRAQLPFSEKLWFLTLTDASMHREWLFRVASTSAIERVAHFLCESNMRLMAIGHSDGNCFTLQLTQPEVGEICGVTSIHVNRMLRELRQSSICSWQRNVVEIHDLGRLVEIAAFSPDYLYYDAALTDRFDAAASRHQ